MLRRLAENNSTDPLAITEDVLYKLQIILKANAKKYVSSSGIALGVQRNRAEFNTELYSQLFGEEIFTKFTHRAEVHQNFCKNLAEFLTKNGQPVKIASINANYAPSDYNSSDSLAGKDYTARFLFLQNPNGTPIDLAKFSMMCTDAWDKSQEDSQSPDVRKPSPDL